MAFALPTHGVHSSFPHLSDSPGSSGCFRRLLHLVLYCITCHGIGEGVCGSEYDLLLCIDLRPAEGTRLLSPSTKLCLLHVYAVSLESVIWYIIISVFYLLTYLLSTRPLEGKSLSSC